jgi:hypothetical protein
MGGGHLPPYLCSGLVINLQGLFDIGGGIFVQGTGAQFDFCSMSVVDIYHHICAVDW